jgi:V/A-type H+/Na+-transporting ATPase subunit F
MSGPVNLHCIADEDTVRGFRLAGVPGQAVTDPRQAAEAVAAVAARPECGMLILTEPVAAGVRAQVDALRLAQDRPLIVEIPGPAGPLAGRKGLRQLVQEAVGVRLEPQGK